MLRSEGWRSDAAACGFGTVCSAVVTQTGTHTYRAVVGTPVQATSSNVTVTCGTGGGTRTEVIVDDTSSGFNKGGTAAYWNQASIGYGSHMWWTYVRQSGVDNWATWAPQLNGAGNYEVFVYVPSNYAGYRIHHNGVDDGRRINQMSYSDVWVTIGTYYFSAAGGEYVFMGDETFEVSGSQRIGFDAIKFVPR